METGLIIALVLFLILLVMGLPLGWVFFLSTALALFTMGKSLLFTAGAYYHTLDSYILMAISFFIFAGNLMAVSGIAERIVRLAYALVGKIRGGLIDAGIVASAFMGALTGSSVPCIAALVPLLVPQLEKFGYERKYSTAVICSSSFLGYLIPPSVPGLLYCMIAQQSIAAIFLATVFPAILVIVGYLLVNSLICHRYYKPSKEIPILPSGFQNYVKEASKSFWLALPALGCPIIVLVGIYGGIFTPNEAGSVAVVYTAICGLFFYRVLKAETLWNAMLNTVITMGLVAFLLGFGTVFTRFLLREGLDQAVANFIMSISQDKYTILMMINVLLLIMGMFIDGIPIIILTVPLLLPIVANLDINLVHLGSIVVLNIGVGVITPPFAMSIFVGSRISGASYSELVPPMMPYFLFVGLPVLILTTYIPWLSCWLPTYMLGGKIIGAW